MVWVTLLFPLLVIFSSIITVVVTPDMALLGDGLGESFVLHRANGFKLMEVLGDLKLLIENFITKILISEYSKAKPFLKLQ